MPPKNQNTDPASNQQGAFFTEKPISSGSTEPTQFSADTHFVPTPDGVYPTPDDVLSDEQAGGVTDAVHSAVTTGHRHKGQLGKHSSLERAGGYGVDLKVGDFLPGFGPVTHSNRPAAEQYAHELDTKRSKQH